jgi:hypothetical protein
MESRGRAVPSIRIWIAACLASGALIVPSAARADDEPAPPPRISVRVDSVPLNTSVQIEREEDGEAVLRCLDSCGTALASGRYRLRLRASDGETIATQTVSVTHPVMFHAVGSPGAATTGLVLGIVGTAIAVTGLAAFGLSALSSMCESDGCGAARGVAIYGLVALPIGAIMTPIGWVMFAHNRHTFRSEDLKEHDAKAAPTVHFGFLPSAQGASGAVTLTF